MIDINKLEAILQAIIDRGFAKHRQAIRDDEDRKKDEDLRLKIFEIHSRINACQELILERENRDNQPNVV